MKVSGRWLRREIAIGLVMLLMAPFGVAAARPEPQDQSQNPQQSQQQDQNPPANNPAGNSGTTASTSQLPAAPQAAQQESTQQRQTKAPLGTAAAPVENPVGVAVSRPAGAAIAPAKQRRARIFLIRMGLVIGAAVAVGTVVGLSKASPSRPH